MKQSRLTKVMAILADIFTIIMFTVWFLSLLQPEVAETVAFIGRVVV